MTKQLERDLNELLYLVHKVGVLNSELLVKKIREQRAKVEAHVGYVRRDQ
jgi:hypothetical protein